MKFTRQITVVIALTLVGIILCSAFAGAESLIARYSYISSISATLRVTGSTATASGRIIPTTGYASDVSVMLQEQQSDGSWVTIASWNASNPSGYSNTGGTATIVTGYSYRTYVIGHVYDSDNNVIDSATAYKYQ